MSIWDTSLETANRWYDVSWYGLLIAGVITALAALFSVAFLYLQFWSSTVRDKHSNLRTSQLELRAAEANEAAAKATERTAELTKEAEAARLEQERLKRQLAWRRLSQEQIKSIAADLSGTQIKMHLGAISSDPEAMLFADDIRRALAAAGIGLKIQGTMIFSQRPIVGLIISGVKEEVEFVGTAFGNAGLKVVGRVRPKELEVLVGSKPPPE
jgi:hypothetical protein